MQIKKDNGASANNSTAPTTDNSRKELVVVSSSKIVLTTSRKVTDRFGKRHNDVLRAIANLRKIAQVDFFRKNSGWNKKEKK